MALAERIVDAPRPTRAPRPAARTADGRLVRIGDRAQVPRGAVAPGRTHLDGDEAAPSAPRKIAPRRRTIRSRRPTSAGMRAHNLDDRSARSTARAERAAIAAGQPLVRATAAIQVEVPAPGLRLVPRRRRAARFVAVLCGVVVLVMLGAAAFQTQLARRQVQLDQLDQDITSAREHYDTLRRERAELRSPSRLAEIATEIGMVTATDTDFMVMTPDVLAELQQTAGQITTASNEEADPLEQFRNVKAVTDGAP